MNRQHIRATPSWRKGPPRHDCVVLNKDSNLEGFRGLHVARVCIFFSFMHGGVNYPCALVEWFTPVDPNEPCANTGMWIVKPDVDRDGRREVSVIHLDSVVRGVHLIGVYGDEFLPRRFKHTDTLDAFQSYYVNKYADHHLNETVF